MSAAQDVARRSSSGLPMGAALSCSRTRIQAGKSPGLATGDADDPRNGAGANCTTPSRHSRYRQCASHHPQSAKGSNALDLSMFEPPRPCHQTKAFFSRVCY